MRQVSDSQHRYTGTSLRAIVAHVLVEHIDALVTPSSRRHAFDKS